jgi:large subunit ribosomal protein L22
MADEQNTTENDEPEATQEPVAEAEPKPKRAPAKAKAAKADEGAKAEAGEQKSTTSKARGAGTRAAAKPKADAEAKPRRATAKAKADDAAAEGEEKAKPKRAAAKPKADDAAKAETAPAAEAKKPAPTRAAKQDEPAAKPARRERTAAEAPTRPVVRAQAKYVRSSARKARLVCDHIRGKSVEEARAILAFTPRAVAKDWSKVLESAVANAEHNHELDGDRLLVKAAHADEGPTLKRFRPRAMGRATPIHKRTSHLTILLTPKE